MILQFQRLVPLHQLLERTTAWHKITNAITIQVSTCTKEHVWYSFGSRKTLSTAHYKQAAALCQMICPQSKKVNQLCVFCNQRERSRHFLWSVLFIAIYDMMHSTSANAPTIFFGKKDLPNTNIDQIFLAVHAYVEKDRMLRFSTRTMNS